MTVNIPLSDWGTSLQDKHLSVTRGIDIPFQKDEKPPFDLIGLIDYKRDNSGIHRIVNRTQFDSVSFTYIDTTVGMYTYYYAVCARAKSTPIQGGIVIGMNEYVDITCEELFLNQ